jgi:aryl-alcohol dehydrogenase-like predicted oxidoreductase
MTEITAPDGSRLSPLCFGTMQFGGTADETDSREMWDACRAVGLNFFDTAFVYTEGRSETFTGRFARDERDRLVIATKAGYTGGSGKANLRAQFDESRRRLGMDMVDILYLHRWDGETPLGETFETLAEMQGAGQIRYIGVSNFAAWQVMKAQAVAAGLGTRIDILQPMYSLVKRQAEVEILPMARAEGIAVAPYSPLGGGLLTGKYGAGGEGRLTADARYAARYGEGWMHFTAQALAEQARAMHHDPATIAVAWAARHPGVTAPIVSARNARQLAPSLAAATLEIDAAAYAEISALSQTPPPATDRLEEAGPS